MGEKSVTKKSPEKPQKQDVQNRWITIWLVFEPTPLKNMIVKLEIFPNFRGKRLNNIWVATT